MTLRERYEHKSADALIHVLENPENYTAECLAVVREIFENRNIDPQESHRIAYEAAILIAKNKITTLDPLNDELALHTSQFLSQEEVRTIYQNLLEEYMKQKEAFRFDVWMYSLGAIV